MGRKTFRPPENIKNRMGRAWGRLVRQERSHLRALPVIFASVSCFFESLCPNWKEPFGHPAGRLQIRNEVLNKQICRRSEIPLMFGQWLHTTRKQALGPPQKYRYGDEPVPVDGIFEWALGTGWYYQPVPKALHRYRVVTFILVPGGTTNRYL